MTTVPYTNVRAMTLMSVTIDLGSVAANTSEEETATVPGVRVGDLVVVAKSDLDAGLVIGTSRVTADDTIAIQVINTTGSPINAASETMQVLVVRPEGAVGLGVALN